MLHLDKCCVGVKVFQAGSDVRTMADKTNEPYADQRVSWWRWMALGLTGKRPFWATRGVRRRHFIDTYWPARWVFGVLASFVFFGCLLAAHVLFWNGTGADCARNAVSLSAAIGAIALVRRNSHERLRDRIYDAASEVVAAWEDLKAATGLTVLMNTATKVRLARVGDKNAAAVVGAARNRLNQVDAINVNVLRDLANVTAVDDPAFGRWKDERFAIVLETVDLLGLTEAEQAQISVELGSSINAACQKFENVCRTSRDLVRKWSVFTYEHDLCQRTVRYWWPLADPLLERNANNYSDRKMLAFRTADLAVSRLHSAILNLEVDSRSQAKVESLREAMVEARVRENAERRFVSPAPSEPLPKVKY